MTHPIREAFHRHKTDPTMTPQKWVQWACDCAERVAHVVSKHHPDDESSYATLLASRLWVTTSTEEQARVANAFADAAWAYHGSTKATTNVEEAAYALRATARVISNISYAEQVADAAANAVRLNPSSRAKGTNREDYEAEIHWQIARLNEIADAN